MQASFDTTRSPERGFTLIELLVVFVVGLLMLAGFTTFYLSQQRMVRHHQAEVALSQELRTAIEQMSRDLRSARKDVTRDYINSTGGAQPTFLTWSSNEVKFELDANDDGDKTDADEVRGYHLNGDGKTIEQYDSSSDSWSPLATSAATTLALTYLACDGTAATTANGIATIGINLTMTQTAVGGLPITRNETEQVRLRNVRCS
jgi:prepilin-type N-terminal cleavage/methylation domain-containing protein